MATIVWSAGALEEIALIRFYIEQFDPGAAGRVSIRLLAAGESLTVFHGGGEVLMGRFAG